jgi:hypothetical protein
MVKKATTTEAEAAQQKAALEKKMTNWLTGTAQQGKMARAERLFGPMADKGAKK